MVRRISIVSLVLVSSSSIAVAQGADPQQPPQQPAPTLAAATPAPEATTAAPTVVAPAPAPVPEPSTSGLRNGFSLSAGQEFGGDRDISATLFGFDWRIGYRISEPLSVYLHSHLSFGSGKEGNGASGITGNFAAALIGEYM
jgi:hypothetical protein